MYREEWLDNAKNILQKDLFDMFGYKIPDGTSISVGWPSSGGLSKAKRRVGECWACKTNKDVPYQVFVSPFLDDRVEVLGTLVHELVHAIVGVEEKHGAAFKKVAHRVGLTGSPSESYAGTHLREKLANLVDRLGPYPHTSIDRESVDRKKQATRMLLLEANCPDCDGYKLRTTKQWINKCGLPMCVHGQSFLEVKQKTEVVSEPTV